MSNPKVCGCGSRAICYDSRHGTNGWRRRYRCQKCGLTYATLEIRVDDRTGNDPLRMPGERETVAKARALIASIQALLQEL